MIAALLTILSAFLLGSSSILEKKGLKNLDSSSGVLISLSVNLIIYWVGTLCFSPLSFDSIAILFFIIYGLLAEALGRNFKFLGFDKVGVSASRPIIASQTFFAIIASITVLSETLSLQIGIGTLLIILGIILISPKGGEKRGWKKRWLLFPIFAAACFGIGDVIRKIGLNILPLPLFAATISVSAAWGAFASYFTFSRKHRFTYLNRRNISWFCWSGIFTSAAILLEYYALTLGTVVLISPLINTTPLFALFLSHLFLRDFEKVTKEIITAAIFIAVGASIIALF